MATSPALANDALFDAARNGNAAKVRELLAQGVDVNAKWRYDTTALLMAARRGHTEVVKELLEHGADPNARDTIYGLTPLLSAVQNGSAEIVRMLLAKDAEGRDQALMSAVGGNKLQVVEAILQHGGIKPATLSAALASATGPDQGAVAGALRRAGATASPEPKLEVATKALRGYLGTLRQKRGARLAVAALLVLFALVAAPGWILYRSSKRR